MKIARIRSALGASYGRVDGGWVTPLALDGEAATGDLLEREAFAAAAPSGASIPLSEARLLAPIVRPGKIVAIGLNYVDHAAEASQTVPSEPLVFAKFSSSIVGPDEPIEFDRGLTDGVDPEAELAVVIGRRSRSVGHADAMRAVAGYTCLNDVSARDLQFADGQWVRGKSLDSFCPIGPWIVTPDELPDPGSLAIRCDVSGESLQDATTADMVFGVAELIVRLSASFTLEPGDVIATGTPPGVGWFRTPRRVLHDGDVVTVEIEGIGRLRNPVRARG